MKNIRCKMRLMIFLAICIFLPLATAAETDSFISQVKENPDSFSIVVGNISDEEMGYAENLSIETGLNLFYDFEIEDSENLILIGNKTNNIKIKELGSNSGSFYVYNENLFISGSKQQNIDNIGKLIERLSVSDSTDETNQVTAVDESKANSSDEEDKGFLQMNTTNKIIVYVLLLTAIIIVIFLVYSFLRKPKFQHT